MTLLRTFKDLLLALHGGTEPRHLAAGFALGAAFGLVPKGNLCGVVFFLLFFVFNVDKGMAFLSALFFSAVGYALDPVTHALGLALLKAGALRGLWTALYDLPIVPLTRFNNTVVLGSFVLGAILFAPLYFGFLKAVALYDSTLRARVEALPLVKALRRWDFAQKWYGRYKAWLA